MSDLELTQPGRQRPARKHPAHEIIVRDGEPTIVYLTVCTKDRVPWLATVEHHDWLRSIWREATAWYVGRYVLMPDHLHLFASPGVPELPLERWVQFWKSQFTKKHKDRRRRWQTDHWDVTLRSMQSYDEKWQYFVNNPTRHGLVECADDWPYQGELFELRWE